MHRDPGLIQPAQKRPPLNKPARLVLVLAALLLTSCAPLRIAQIQADPLRYRNRTVHVEGIVTGSAGVFQVGGYQLDDGTGKIFVLSTRGLPSKGAHVKVSGNVLNGVTVGTRSFGTAIQAHSQHIR